MDITTLAAAIITNGIGTVCAAAVLWFAYHRETKTIPAMLETFAKTSAADNMSFEARNTRVVESFVRVIGEERAICQKWHEENRHLLQEIKVESRENRHLIRDLANQMGLRKAVDDEKAKRDLLRESAQDEEV